MSRPKRRRPAKSGGSGAERILIVVAGPNGAGKSTFYEEYLRSLDLPFVGADPIARELSPQDPSAVAYDAAKIAEHRRQELVAAGQSFCMETVFSDPQGDKVAFLRRAQEQGYAVVLIFIGLESAELAVARVLERVDAGGHDVPDAKVTARYPRTLNNLAEAVRFVDRAYLFDNSSAERPFRHVATFEVGKEVVVADQAPAWAAAACGRGGRHPSV